MLNFILGTKVNETDFVGRAKIFVLVLIVRLGADLNRMANAQYFKEAHQWFILFFFFNLNFK